MPTGLCSGDGSKADRSMTGSLSRPPRQDSRIFIPIETCNGIAVLVRRQKHVLKYQNISGSPAAGLFYLHQMEKAVFWINPEYSNAVVSTVGHI